MSKTILGLLVVIAIPFVGGWCGVAKPAMAQAPDARLVDDLAWLDRTFTEQEHEATWWWSGWLVFLSGASVGNAAAGTWFLDGGQRTAAGINVLGSTFGVVNMAIAPELMVFASSRWDAIPDEQPEHKRVQGCAMLHEAARRQESYRAPVTFILPAVWTGVSATFLQLRYRNTWLTLGTAGGIVGVEGLRLATAPQGARSSWREAQARGICKERPNTAARVAEGQPSVALIPGPQGLTLLGRW